MINITKDDYYFCDDSSEFEEDVKIFSILSRRLTIFSKKICKRATLYIYNALHRLLNTFYEEAVLKYSFEKLDGEKDEKIKSIKVSGFMAVLDYIVIEDKKNIKVQNWREELLLKCGSNKDIEEETYKKTWKYLEEINKWT